MPVSRRRPLPHVIRRGDRGLFDLDPEFSNPARQQQAFNLGLPDCGVPLCQTSRCRRKLFVEGYSVGCAGVYWNSPALVDILICPGVSGVRFLESGGVVGAEVAVLVLGWGEHAKAEWRRRLL